ncbi:MAG TPA: hypothetical protein VGS07_17005 [Thermoanaerobaculia bacterium]|nr:hypothetical protein [Thermoanaerobaculia bacterium]
MKVATFSVRATMPQSIAWKRAAEAEGFPSCGAWLSRAADAYLRLRAKAGLPLPLAWHRGRFTVRLEDGAEPEVRGWIARPFGHYSGTDAGPGYHGCHLHTLVYLPARRIVATFRYAREAKALAAELSGLWARSGGEGEDIRAGPLIERHEREAT